MKVTIVSILCIVLTGSIFLSAYAQEAVFKTETVASNLEIPWSIAFAPDGRIFFTERNGNVKVIEDGDVKQVARIDVARAGEGGLLGIALDPDFANNHYVYLYYTYSEFFALQNRVSRFTEMDNKLTNEEILVDKIPGAAVHDGGRIAFGPDGKLYVTTGDAANAGSSQDLNSLAGKILRVNPDGSIPDDNPFPNSLVYSYGHRNPQGLDWDPVTGKLVVTEHGPSGEKGFAHDEVNVIEPGKNYGWPNIVGDANDPKYVDPIIHTGDVTWAPSGASFYDGDKFPEWKNKFFIATLRGSHLRILGLDTENNNVTSNEAILQNTFGRLRDVVQGPDGYIYILTSNRDGRGSPAPTDDRIIRLVPELELEPSETFQLEYGGIEFSVKHEFTNGSIVDIAVDEESTALILLVSTSTNEDGILEVTLPRILIDSKKEMIDDEFIVLVDGEETEVEELQTTEKERTLRIHVAAGAERIEIFGTEVIPEFPFAIVIASILIAIMIAIIRFAKLNKHGGIGNTQS